MLTECTSTTALTPRGIQNSKAWAHILSSPMISPDGDSVRQVLQIRKLQIEEPYIKQEAGVT